jgi:metal-sulfur cluster biosynthetic enzyme
MLTVETIREALRDCYDPEIPMNIVDLGLVQEIEVESDPDAPGAGIAGVPPRFRVRIQANATSADDAARAQMTAQIANRLAGLPQVSRSHVQIEESPEWTPARITPDGRRILKLDQPAFPILNNRVR